jgi:tRNA dimethylallyltransferase
MKVLIVCGPTATGKTALAAKLAKQFSGEIISADSRQVYQEMDIVTGKDRPRGVTILGYDLVKPDENFSVAHFIDFAVPQIKALVKKRKLPIVVGGTGLWLKALVEPIETIAVSPNPQLRKNLKDFSAGKLFKLLKELNSVRAKNMNHSDRNNPRRLIRAIEVTKSRPAGKVKNLNNMDVYWVGLTASLKILDDKIEKRVRQRLKLGAIKEWEKLTKTYSQKLPSMSALGYQQLPDIKKWITAEKQYLRRQITWFKKMPYIHWFDLAKDNWTNDVVRRVRSWYTNA